MLNRWFDYFTGAPEWIKMLVLIAITVFGVTVASLLFNAFIELIK